MKKKFNPHPFGPKLFSSSHSFNIFDNPSLVIGCPNLSLSYDVNMFGTSSMKFICNQKDVFCAENFPLKCVNISCSIDLIELNMFIVSSLILVMELICFLVFLSPNFIHVSLFFMWMSSSHEQRMSLLLHSNSIILCLYSSEKNNGS